MKTKLIFAFVAILIMWILITIAVVLIWPKVILGALLSLGAYFAYLLLKKFVFSKSKNKPPSPTK
jgi:apolipoprotein N-acyltransferase